MPGFSTEVPHSLDQDKVVNCLKNFADQVQKEYQDQVTDMQGEWNGNCLNYSFTAYTFKIQGSLNVTEKTVEIKGNLPMPAMMFRGKIEQTIASEVQKALEAA